VPHSRLKRIAISMSKSCHDCDDDDGSRLAQIDGQLVFCHNSICIQVVQLQHSSNQLSHLAQMPAGAQIDAECVDRSIRIADVSELLTTHCEHQVLAEVSDLTNGRSFDGHYETNGEGGPRHYRNR
jgi:hypothetical protein